MAEEKKSRRALTSEEINAIRNQLLERKQTLWSHIRHDLENEAGEKHRAVLDTMREHGDRALEDLRESAAISLVELKVQELEAIEAALRRIDSRQYGRCADCGRWIRPARLETMPYCVRCRSCQEKLEQIENV